MNYFVGLDMGTNSVGWAVTDSKYNLIRVKGKDFWGVREFDEAKGAVDRRTKRISRRRRQREVARIGELKLRFEEEITKEDPLFFIRMENSKYFSDDKDLRLKSVNSIFDDEDYKDSNYFSEYPTVFHLRKALIEDSLEHDAKYSRLVYLALLNMFKHRGHFLNFSLNDSDETLSFDILYNMFVESVGNELEISFPIGVSSKVESILADNKTSRTAKYEMICNVCGFGKDAKVQELLIKLFCGLKIDAKKVFADIETENKIDICFEDAGYEEKKDEYLNVIGETRFEVIELAKQIYDAGVLSNVLHGEDYLSYARVKQYEKHKSDLKLLKTLYRDYFSQEDYNKMFRNFNDEEVSYSAYIGSNQTGTKKKRRSYKGRDRDSLYKIIKKQLSNVDDERAKFVLTEIDNETFLPKQLSFSNGIIPNQVHKKEMKAILKNAEKYLPFLKELGSESGFSIAEEIIQIFSFQIPYYIGPLSERSKTGWVCRNEGGKVYPWNINQKVDVEKTQEEFIKRLIRECTYLSGEKVMPKASLAYEKFAVLNEINNLKIDGEKITVELKQAIYTELFCRKNRVTKEKLTKYLCNQGYITDENQLSGIDTNINNALSSYNKFFAILGDRLNTDTYRNAVERIIELATIYGDAKTTLKNIIVKDYSDLFSEAEIKRILGFKFHDWGRLSKTLLNLQGCDKETGEIYSLLDTLWNSNDNFMEIINNDNKYTFKEELNNKRVNLTKSLAEFSAEDLEDFYFSAPVKRMINQTICLLKEIVDIMGEAPSRVFVEIPRGKDNIKGDAGRTNSRSKQLMELYKTIRKETKEWEIYKKIKDENREWKNEIKNAEENGSLRSKKLYLYYMQMGRCMYSGEQIDLAELFTPKYDIDHIYPRCFVKDDNISNNLVLVNKPKNAEKSDKYPIEGISKDVREMWRWFHVNKWISDEKYNRLMGSNPLTDEQKAGFIARQLVETSQGTKGVINILKQLLPETQTTIVYSKASNISDFRRDFKFLKSRSVNDFHHAKDAYLNIVVGNVYYTKFTQNPIRFIKEDLARDEKKYHYHLGKMFERDIERNGVVAWYGCDKNTKRGGTIDTVAKVMNKNTPIITRLTFEAKGAITNDTLYSANKTKGEGYIPLKTSDTRMKDMSRYGGFNNVSGAYFMLIEHTVKGKQVRTLEMIPIYMKDRINSEEDVIRYCVDNLYLEKPIVRVAKIKMQSLVRIDGFLYRLSGRTGKQIFLRNEISMCLNSNNVNYIHLIDKVLEDKSIKEGISKKENIDLYNTLLNKHVDGIFKSRKNPVGETLKKGLCRFEELSEMEQCKVLGEILKLSAIAPTSADLTLIGGSAKTGVMLCSKDITKANEFALINQSVTGVYSSEIDLLTV